MGEEQWWTVSVPRGLFLDTDLQVADRHVYIMLASQAEAGRVTRVNQRRLLELTRIGSFTTLGNCLTRLQERAWLKTAAQRRSRSPTTYELTVAPGASRPVIKIPWILISHRALSTEAKGLYALLLAHCQPGARATSMRWHDLLAIPGLYDRAVRRSRDQLTAAGWLRDERNRRTGITTYILLDPHRAMRELAKERAAERLHDRQYKGELLMQLMLSELVTDTVFIDNARPGFLINPYTTERMELDRWYTDAKVAFEFQGPQHDRPTALFPDADEHARQYGRDLMKAPLTGDQKIHLIAVRPHELTFAKLAEKIGDLLPMRTLQPEDPLVAYLALRSRRYVAKVKRETF